MELELTIFVVFPISLYLCRTKSIFNAMKRRILTASLISLCCIAGAKAQLSSNPDKFLGNITTGYQVDWGNEKFYTLWNQITCENESKWASVEGTNNSFNWGGCDAAVNYAKQHGFPFKFHALIWGAQYPSWIEKQTPEQRYKEIVQWLDAAKKRYPDLQLIDVVNEAVSGHQGGTHYFEEALGGTGKTGYDWIIKAFELAYERWPDAILIYNDYNTFQWNTDQYIDLVKTLRDAGAPIDAYGCQSHDLTDLSLSNFKSTMTKIQNALKMPMYSTEYDIGTNDDALQLQRYKEQIPYMWEADYVAGITLWGYIYGHTWTTDGNSGIIRNGKDRPAMTWLREYMQTDAAKTAKSPFPGMVKEASVYVQPEALSVEKGTELPITVRARMRTKTISKIDLYVKGSLIATLTEAPYATSYTPTVTGAHEIKAVVTCTDGSTYTRYSSFSSCNPRAPYKNTPSSLPGVLQAENFDTGAEGIAFHDANSSKEGDASSYRSDEGGIDVVKGGSGYAVGYTQVGEWMEYTIDVKEAGLYAYTINYSTPETGTTIALSLSTAEGLVPLTDGDIALPSTGEWSTYKNTLGRLIVPLEAGQQVLRLSIAGGNATYVANIDKITFEHIILGEDIQLALSANPDPGTVGSKVTLTADVQSSTEIKNVRFYQDGVLKKNSSNYPYFYSFVPTAKGTATFIAYAVDVEGRQSPLASYTVTIQPKRVPYKGAISLPGIIEAENFDKGGEGHTFHDSDAKDSGASGYRTDNEGADIVRIASGGYALSDTQKGEWYEYTVNVKEPGLYSCEAVVGATTTGASFYLGEVVDGENTNLWRISAPKTGSDTYTTIKSVGTKELTEGTHILRITINGNNCMIDKLELKCTVPADIEVVELDSVSNDGILYNVYGIPVGSDCKGIVIQNGKKLLKR